VQEAWFGGPAAYRHAVVFVFGGEVVGDADAGWTQDHAEIAEVAWVDPGELSAQTAQPLHWPALRKAGLVQEGGRG
jgi:hypothetical protein